MRDVSRSASWTRAIGTSWTGGRAFPCAGEVPAAAAAGVKRKHPGSGAPGGPAPPGKRKKGKKGKAPAAENAERQQVLEAYKRLKAKQKKTVAPR